MKIHLIYKIYWGENAKRNNEIFYCYLKHVFNSHIDKMTVIGDFLKPPVETSKQNFVHYSYMASFNDLFNLSLQGCINIFCNSDTFFDQTIRLARQIKKNEFYVISRQNIKKGEIQDSRKGGAQDAWIWKDKCKINAPFCPGTLGCDNKLAYLAKNHYKVKNPCLSINLYHKHDQRILSGKSDRANRKVVPPPYSSVKPTYLKK